MSETAQRDGSEECLDDDYRGKKKREGKEGEFGGEPLIRLRDYKVDIVNPVS